MPSSVKERATESAQRAGVSLNSWTVDILERALENLRQRQSEPDDPEARSGASEDRVSESGSPEPKGDANSAGESGNGLPH